MFTASDLTILSGKQVYRELPGVRTLIFRRRFSDSHTRNQVEISQKSGRLAEPDHQLGKARPVLLAYRRELQRQPSTGLYAPYNTVGPDLSLLNQKLQLHYGTQSLRYRRLDK
jgi:hypothetical protein